MGLELWATTQIEQDAAFGLGGMIMSRLRRRRPQHQGHAEPRRPSHPAKRLLTYQEFPALGLDSFELITVIHRNATAGQVTIEGRSSWPHNRPGERTYSQTRGNHGRTHLRRTESQALSTRKRSRNQKTQRRPDLQVGEKGGVSVYGLGRFPVTLYYEQWNRLLGAANEIKAFMEENKSKLKLKDQA